MENPQILIIGGILILAVAAGVLFLFPGKEVKKLSPLAGTAFAFFIAGLVLGRQTGTAYILFGIGALLAVADIIIKQRKP